MDRRVVTALPALIGVCCLLVSGCASSRQDTFPLEYQLPPELQRQVEQRVSFANVKADPAAYKGRIILLGGEVLKAKRLADRTRLEILHLPLNEFNEPVMNRTVSQGRYLAFQKEFLDPATVPPGTRVTVVGEVTGTTEGDLDCAGDLPHHRDAGPRGHRRRIQKLLLESQVASLRDGPVHDGLIKFVEWKVKDLESGTVCQPFRFEHLTAQQDDPPLIGRRIGFDIGKRNPLLDLALQLGRKLVFEWEGILPGGRAPGHKEATRPNQSRQSRDHPPVHGLIILCWFSSLLDAKQGRVAGPPS